MLFSPIQKISNKVMTAVYISRLINGIEEIMITVFTKLGLYSSVNFNVLWFVYGKTGPAFCFVET